MSDYRDYTLKIFIACCTFLNYVVLQVLAEVTPPAHLVVPAAASLGDN